MTLFIIIFLGGYTSDCWKSRHHRYGGLYVKNEDTFIFSITNPENRAVVFNAIKNEDHIFDSRITGPCFGFVDIRIVDKPNVNKSNTNLGLTFEGLLFYFSIFYLSISFIFYLIIVCGYKFQSENAINFLFGSPNFSLDDIEVYQLEILKKNFFRN